MNPTPIRHFGASPGSYAAPAVSRPGGGWLCSSASRGRSAGRISRSVSQRGRHARGHIPVGICRVDRGNSSKPRIKTPRLFRCSDNKAGDFPLLLFCVSWERLSGRLMATRAASRLQKHISHLHFGIGNLPTKEKSSISSSVELEARHSALKPCQDANTWQPFGIIKTGHAPQPPPCSPYPLIPPPLPTLPGNSIHFVAASSTSPANHTYSTICLEWY